MAIQFNKKHDVPSYDQPQDDSTEVRKEAERLVLNQHGPYAYKLKGYEELVQDTIRQMQKAVEDNKTF